jgi:hypothetical protein
MSLIDARASRGQCCFMFLHYDRSIPKWAKKLDISYCPKLICSRDEMLCEEHYLKVSGVEKREAATRRARERYRRYRRGQMWEQADELLAE